jgi:hypothetical protein
MSITTRSPNGHFSFNSTGPLGVLNSDFVSSLPDLLQPTQDRLNARVTAISNVFLFIYGDLCKTLLNGWFDCASEEYANDEERANGIAGQLDDRHAQQRISGTA